MNLIRRHRILVAALAIGLVLRGAMLLWYLRAHDGQGETWEYEIIAANILEGRGFSLEADNGVFRSYVMPLFPLVCALLHWIGGPGLGLFYCFQLAVSLGIIFMTWRLARAWLGERAAGWAAAMAAVEPGMIVYQSYKVDVNALATLALLVGLGAFMRLRESPGSRWAIATGVIMGSGMLMRLDLVAIVAALMVWSLRGQRGPLVRRSCFLALAAAALSLSPWVARNYRVHGRFVPFSTGGGWVLWAGNNPDSLGTLITRGGQGVLESAPEEFRRRVSSADEIGQMTLFREEAWRHIRTSPGAFLSGLVRKFWYFWWFSPAFASYYEWIRPWMTACYKLLHLLALALAALGLSCALGREGREARELTFCLAAVVLAQACIHSLYYVEMRHRLLVMPLLLALAARGWVAVLEHRGQ